MPKKPSDPELKKEFSAEIRKRLKKLKPRDIAAILGLKNSQMVYNYRDNKNAPSPEVIRRAMEAWPDFSLTYRGKTLTLQDYQRKSSPTAKPAVQYELWEAIKTLDADSIEIEILKKESSSIRLGVHIRFESG